MLAIVGLLLAVNGAMPSGGVVDGGDALYGTAAIGGPHCLSPAKTDLQNVGRGVVFRLSYDGSWQSIHGTCNG